MYKKILLATDGSENSDRAVKRVIDMEKAPGTEIVVFTSIHQSMIPRAIPLPFSLYTLPQSDYDRLYTESRTRGEEILKRIEHEFKTKGINVETRLLIDTEPADYAIKASKEENFDLIVVGCKGHHSKLRQVFLGTVPTQILNEAACDVLVVR